MSIQITTELIKELRDRTNVSIMQCKKALEEAEGDIEKAVIILRQKSSGIAEKKADREANDGLVIVKENNGKAIILTLHCETDFVAKNSDFISLADKLSDIILNEGIDTLKEKQADMINEVVQKIGEKIELGKVEEIEGEVLGNYVHGGKKAVIVSLKGGSSELAKDIAMHIAAMNPAYISSENIPEEDKMKAKEIFEKEVAESDKPADIKEKMLEGKLNTYFKEQTLLDQSFIKNPELTISKLLQNSNASIEKFISHKIG
jgi:elongation factor Ts